MANQTFSVAHRRALWSAYNYRCFYCDQILGWDDLQIDHVIPEHLAKQPEKLCTTLDELGLPIEWNLCANENLVPAHARCNAKKRGLQPPARQMLLWLTVTQANALKVNFLHEQYKQESRSDINRAKLETALAAGWINEEDVREALASVQFTKKATIPLTYGVDLLDGPVVQELKPSDVDKLLDLPIRAGMKLTEGLRLVRGGTEERYVHTCREYARARDEGFYAATTFEMKMEAFFIQTLGLLEAVRACRPSRVSFVRAPRMGICDLNAVPSDVLILFGEGREEDYETLKKYPTVMGLLNAEKARLISVGSDHLAIEFLGFVTHIRELLRGDLDGDGVEDILISRYLYAERGTLGLGTEPVVLAKTSESDPFVVSGPVQQKREPIASVKASS